MSDKLVQLLDKLVPVYMAKRKGEEEEAGDARVAKSRQSWFEQMVSTHAERARSERSERRKMALTVLEGFLAVPPLCAIVLEYTAPYGIYALRVPFQASHIVHVLHGFNRVVPREYLDYVFGPLRANNTVVIAYFNKVVRIADQVQHQNVREAIANIWASDCGRYTCVAKRSEISTNAHTFSIIDWTVEQMYAVNLPTSFHGQGDDVDIAYNHWSFQRKCFVFRVDQLSTGRWALVCVSPLTGRVKQFIPFAHPPTNRHVTITTEGQALSFHEQKVHMLDEHGQLTELALDLAPEKCNIRKCDFNTSSGNVFTLYDVLAYARPHERFELLESTGQSYSYRLVPLLGSPS